MHAGALDALDVFVRAMAHGSKGGLSTATVPVQGCSQSREGRPAEAGHTAELQPVCREGGKAVYAKVAPSHSSASTCRLIPRHVDSSQPVLEGPIPPKRPAEPLARLCPCYAIERDGVPGTERVLGLGPARQTLQLPRKHWIAVAPAVGFTY